MPLQPHHFTSHDPPKRSYLGQNNLSSWTRHPKLYIQEGTIALLAENTIFRTYSGILSMHSEIFNDMFFLSEHQPPNAEMYDGCSLVRLSDTAEDLAYFLQGLIDISFFPGENVPVPYRIVAGILRLSTKYMVPILRKRAIAHLSRVYTMSFDRYKTDANDAVFGTLEDTPHPFEVLPLLRECRVQKLLPHAFLNACNKGFNSLVNGDKVDEETIHLPPDDARVALLGWRSLHADLLHINIRRGLAANERPCESQQFKCFEARRIVLKVMLYGLATNSDIRLTLLDLPKHGVCATCAVAWQGPHEIEIRGIWHNLPGYFGLPDWAALRDEDS